MIESVKHAREIIHRFNQVDGSHFIKPIDLSWANGYLAALNGLECRALVDHVESDDCVCFEAEEGQKCSRCRAIDMWQEATKP